MSSYSNYYEEYEKLCVQLENELCTERLEKIECFLPTIKRGVNNLRSSPRDIARNAVVMRIFLEGDDIEELIDNPENSANAEYKLLLAGNIIKKGKFSQGIDILGGNFIPFRLALYNMLTLEIDLVNNKDREYFATLRLEIVNIESRILNDLRALSHHVIDIPWKYEKSDSLRIYQGIGGLDKC
jgi:hypothetical protein